MNRKQRNRGKCNWVAVYITNQAFGGPEEGGWWYIYGDPVLGGPIRTFFNRRNAFRYAGAVQEELDKQNKALGRYGDINSVLCSRSVPRSRNQTSAMFVPVATSALRVNMNPTPERAKLISYGKGWTLYRHEQVVQFYCARCKAIKTAKLMASNGNGDRICNGCYGWIKSQPCSFPFGRYDDEENQ